MPRMGHHARPQTLPRLCQNPKQQTIHKNNNGRSPALINMPSATAGICEEIIFRGYFQRQFSAWTGNVSAGVLLSAAAFGAGHIYQGWRSAIIILVYGLLFGILAETRKSLRPGMMTHAWHDGFFGLAGRLIAK